MMKTARGALTLLLSLTLPAAAPAEDVTEPRSGVAFPARSGELSLLGVGLRTKTFLKVKVYAIGLYVSDAALAGPLRAHQGRTATPAFSRELVSGDFPKQLQLKFVRDLSADQVRTAFREALSGADKARVETFVGLFGDVKAGQECVLRWGTGGALETTVAGQARPPIADRAFTRAVFGIWLGERPIQDDIKRGLVSRADLLLK
jgi:hypothetical protein